MRFLTYLKEEQRDIKREYIEAVVKDLVNANSFKSKKEPSKKMIQDLVDEINGLKNFGNKSIDKIESKFDMHVGPVMRLLKAVKEKLSAEFTVSKSSRSQQIDKYPKQKWIKPR